MIKIIHTPAEVVEAKLQGLLLRIEIERAWEEMKQRAKETTTNPNPL